MKQNAYIAIIGDLVSSRELSDTHRRDLQDKLTGYFDTGSSEVPSGMASRPLMTLGDEFQALYVADRDGVEGVLAFIPAIMEQTRPTAVRFGLGIGPLTTSLRETTLGMDGPCFHRARNALERSRAKDEPCKLDTGGGPLDDMWSMLASYALRQRQAWSGPQREAIELYNRLGAWNKVARELQVSPTAVSLRHQAAGWTRYRVAWRALGNGLMHLISVMDDDGSEP